MLRQRCRTHTCGDPSTECRAFGRARIDRCRTRHRPGHRPSFSEHQERKMNRPSSISPRRGFSSIAAVVLVIAAALVFEAAAPSAVQAAPNDLQLQVIERGERSHDRQLQVHHQRRQHRHDRAALAERRLLARRPPATRHSCNWTSMGIDSQSPIFTQGDQSDFAGAGFEHPGRPLPDLGARRRLQARRRALHVPLDGDRSVVRAAADRRCPTPRSRPPCSRTSRR